MPRCSNENRSQKRSTALNDVKCASPASKKRLTKAIVYGTIGANI
ncbi:MAG: hypothetical protein U0X86_000665 [Wolbachia endosymbiont of Xenopsylla cheopis]